MILFKGQTKKNCTMEEKKALLKEADLLKLVGRIIDKWKFIFIVTFCFSVFGVIIALSTVREYTAEIVVAPESSGSSMISSGVSSLASMMGVNLRMSEGNDAIYPKLYPDILTSLPFLSSLFDVRVENIDCTVDTTYYTYLKHYREKTWLDVVKTLPSKTLGKIKGLFSSSQENEDTPCFNPYMLSKKQMSMVENLNSNIGIFVDKKTNVLTLSFTDRDPRVAAIMADTIMYRLQQIITEYRIKKVVDDCEYIEQMYIESKDSMEIAQRNYADFVTRNRNIASEHVLVEKERLEADKELKTALHSQWAQQHLLAKAKVQEKTPVFVTLKPATIPAKPSSMGKMMRLIIYSFLGGVFAVVYVLMKDSVLSAWRKIRRKSE